MQTPCFTPWVINDLELKDSTQPHATIHFQTGHQDKIMHEPLVITILTQYHVSKGLMGFGDHGVAAVLKDLKQLHEIIVTKQKILKKCHVKRRRQR